MSKKEASSIANPVKAKIKRTGLGDLKVSSAGTQVTMSEKDYKYVLDAEKRTEKAQKILESYYEKSE